VDECSIDDTTPSEIGAHQGTAHEERSGRRVSTELRSARRRCCDDGDDDRHIARRCCRATPDRTAVAAWARDRGAAWRVRSGSRPASFGRLTTQYVVLPARWFANSIAKAACASR